MNKRQAETASAYIRDAAARGENCFINHIVFCELVWVLESAYDFGKREISDVLEMILITKQFEIEQKDILRQAIKDYAQGKGDLADYLTGRTNHGYGCIRTATFDRALKDMPSFELLEK
ncbi:MAG: type II toxin-antitoxin system VapC family toxin [Nitrospiraceae bacterium]|nr:type II toxin-antitoxin system VapC family toxin [Nitrospiraceae bacterium]